MIFIAVWLRTDLIFGHCPNLLSIHVILNWAFLKKLRHVLIFYQKLVKCYTVNKLIGMPININPRTNILVEVFLGRILRWEFRNNRRLLVN